MDQTRKIGYQFIDHHLHGVHFLFFQEPTVSRGTRVNYHLPRGVKLELKCRAQELAAQRNVRAQLEAQVMTSSRDLHEVIFYARFVPFADSSNDPRHRAHEGHDRPA